MQINKISLAKKTLLLLEKKSWKNISISSVLKNEKKTIIQNKIELLININRYFDYLLKKNLSNLEDSSKKDMLFEVFMARLDILNSYRKSIKNLLKYLSSNPQDFAKIFPSFAESIILMATISNIKVNGIKGLANIKVIMILYFLIIYSWNKDETESLEKTMTTLDNYLTNVDKLSFVF